MPGQCARLNIGQPVYLCMLPNRQTQCPPNVLLLQYSKVVCTVPDHVLILCMIIINEHFPTIIQYLSFSKRLPPQIGKKGKCYHISCISE